MLLSLLLGLTWALIPGPAAPVMAESTSEALAAAKAEQEKLAAEKERLERQSSQLANQADKLSGELAWLNQRSEEHASWLKRKQPS
jgi:predicted  nucleic acid-binding Zn-ribbon protein